MLINHAIIITICAMVIDLGLDKLMDVGIL